MAFAFAFVLVLTVAVTVLSGLGAVIASHTEA